MKRMQRTSRGWDSEHWQYQCSDGSHPSFWKTVVTSPQWKRWEIEVSRRLSTASALPVFDVDECQECNWLSPEHFQEFLKFCKANRLI